MGIPGQLFHPLARLSALKQGCHICEKERAHSHDKVLFLNPVWRRNAILLSDSSFFPEIQLDFLLQTEEISSGNQLVV